MRRRTLADLQRVATERGGQCLAETFAGSGVRHAFVCGEGHRFETTPVSVLGQDSWCPLCARNARGSIDDLHAMAAARGGRCLSSTYTNRRAHYDFVCAEGHRFEMTGTAVVQRGSWCPRCVGRAPRTLADLEAAARAKGGTCLSETFGMIRDRHWFVCARGHHFESVAAGVLYGRAWCPQCAGNARRTLADAQALAASRGGLCLSERYVNNKTKLAFRCARDHEFAFTLRESCDNPRRWCPACRRLDEQASRYARLRTQVERIGCTLVSTQYVSSKTEVLVRCEERHDWWVRPDRLHPNKRCPHCRPRPKGARANNDPVPVGGAVRRA